VPILLRRTLARRFDRKKTGVQIFVDVKSSGSSALQIPVMRRKFFKGTVTNGIAGPSSTAAALVAFNPGFEKDGPPMTLSTRLALGVSVAALSLSLALAPATFAQDKMGKDDGMKKDSMAKDTMTKATMAKHTMKKDGGMKKDDAMKKDDGMKK
jgi:pentapeptide MXKDX repeat protein